MKYLLLLHLIALVLCSCREYQTEAIQKFIPGMYIRFSQHEYGTEYDTLMLSLQNKTTGEYKIVRKWKYERVLDGVAISPEYKRVTTSRIFDPVHGLLQESETAVLFSFDFNKGLLFSGSTRYKKIK